MGIAHKLWEKKGQGYLKRRAGGRGKPKDTFLIVCEGEKTEPNYFKKFRVSSAKVHVLPTGANTDSLVEIAINIKRQMEKRKEQFNQIWCVLDKDSFPSQKFNRALQIAKNNNIKMAYSNQAFELWYILHFEYMPAGLNRSEYQNKLDKQIGKKYQKNDAEMFQILQDKQDVAIKNARKLLSQYDPHNPDQDNPSTTVHLLVEELNKFR